MMQENKFIKFLSFMWNPLSWVMEAAAIMAIGLANGGVSLRLLQIDLQLISYNFSCNTDLYRSIFFVHEISGARY